MSEVGTLVSTVCRQLNTRGVCPRPGTGIAIQKDGKVYMAPDNIPMDRLTTEDLFIFNSKLDKNGDPDVIKKSRPKAGTTAGPSPFTKLYLGLFEQKPSVGSIVMSQAVSAVLVAKINEKKFSIKENEMISGIIDPVRKVPLGWEDEVVVPIVENTDDIKALLESIKKVCTETKDTNAVLIRNNGIVVWGEDWTLARNMLDSYLYLMDLSVEMKKLGVGSASPSLPVPAVQAEKSVAGGSKQKPKETVENPPKRKKVETPETNKRTENSYKKSPYVKPVVDLALRKKKAALNRLRQDTMAGSGHVPFSSITLSGATGQMRPMSGNMGPMVSPSNGPKVDTINGPNMGQMRNSMDRPMNGPNMGPIRSSSDLGPMNNQNNRGPMGRSESMNGPQGMGSMNGPQGMGPINNQNNMGPMGRPMPMNGPQGMGPGNNQNMMNNQNNMGPMGRSGPMNGPPGMGQMNGPPGMGPMNGPQGMGSMSGPMGMGPGPNNMGPGPNNMGQGPNNMGPGPNNMGPGPNNMGPGPNNMGPGHNMGPGPKNMGPGPSNMGPRGGPVKGGNRFNDRFNKFLKNDKPEGSRRGGEGGGIKRSGDASAGQPHKSAKFSPKKGATKSREKFKSIRPEDY